MNVHTCISDLLNVKSVVKIICKVIKKHHTSINSINHVNTMIVYFVNIFFFSIKIIFLKTYFSLCLNYQEHNNWYLYVIVSPLQRREGFTVLDPSKSNINAPSGNREQIDKHLLIGLSVDLVMSNQYFDLKLPILSGCSQRVYVSNDFLVTWSKVKVNCWYYK